MTKSNKIGAIGGFDFPILKTEMQSFEMGAKSVNPDITCETTFVGTFTDSVVGKEAAFAMINAGVDFLYQNADTAGVGAIAACEQAGIFVMGWGSDQSSLAPDNVVGYVKVDYSKMFEIAIENIMNGKFEGTVQQYGLSSGAIGLIVQSKNVPQEALDAVEKAKADIISGEVILPAPH